jgi:hypothetical protein
MRLSKRHKLTATWYIKDRVDLKMASSNVRQQDANHQKESRWHTASATCCWCQGRLASAWRNSYPAMFMLCFIAITASEDETK